MIVSCESDKKRFEVIKEIEKKTIDMSLTMYRGISGTNQVPAWATAPLAPPLDLWASLSFPVFILFCFLINCGIHIVIFT